MKTKKYLGILVLTLGVICFSFLVFNQTEKNKLKSEKEKFIKDTENLVLSKGYTLEDIQNLRDFQIVDKPYDNEVLERFNKVQGYIYEHYSILPSGLKIYSGNLNTSILSEEDSIRRLELETKYLSNGKAEYCSTLLKYIILPARITNFDDPNAKRKEICKHFGHTMFSSSDLENKTDIQLEETLNSQFNMSTIGSYYTSLGWDDNYDIDFQINLDNYQTIKKEDVDHYIKLGILKEDKNIHNDYNNDTIYYRFEF